MKTSKNETLHPVIWLLMPVLLAVFPYVVKLTDKKLYKKIFLGEFGLTENLTFIFLFIAVIYGIIVIRKTSGFIKAWFILFGLGCFYFGGEEISWGQHFLGWDTPVFFAGKNRQNETNIHNLIPVLDTLPRTILEVLTIIFGIITPVFLKLKKTTFNKNNLLYFLLPSYECIPAAIFSIGISLPARILKIHFTAGEFKECFLAMFLMMYVLSVYKRLRLN